MDPTCCLQIQVLKVFIGDPSLIGDRDASHGHGHVGHVGSRNSANLHYGHRSVFGWSPSFVPRKKVLLATIFLKVSL